MTTRVRQSVRDNLRFSHLFVTKLDTAGLSQQVTLSHCESSSQAAFSSAAVRALFALRRLITGAE